MRVYIVLALAAVAVAQVPCGFSCTREASFTANIDGSRTTAKCTDSKNVAVRCDGCCKSRALSAGLPTSRATGFPSTDGKTCVCCTHNNQCKSNPSPAFSN